MLQFLVLILVVVEDGTEKCQSITLLRISIMLGLVAFLKWPGSI
jgi:hypothetical protein